MDIRIIDETTFDNGESQTHEIDGFSRPVMNSEPEDIGLKLEEAGVGKTWGCLFMMAVSQQRNCHGCADHRRDNI